MQVALKLIPGVIRQCQCQVHCLRQRVVPGPQGFFHAFSSLREVARLDFQVRQWNCGGRAGQYQPLTAPVGAPFYPVPVPVTACGTSVTLGGSAEMSPAAASGHPLPTPVAEVPLAGQAASGGSGSPQSGSSVHDPATAMMLQQLAMQQQMMMQMQMQMQMQAMQMQGAGVRPAAAQPSATAPSGASLALAALKLGTKFL
jgi:hypothetical protein